MHSHIWSYKEPLSDSIKSHLESLTEHLKISEHLHLISDLEDHLGTFVQAKKNQSNAKNSSNRNKKIKSALDKTQQLISEINEILSAECAEKVKMHLLENDEDKWLQLKVLELDIPNHLDSVNEISNYLKMLDSLNNIDNEEITNKTQASLDFFSQFKKTLNKYEIEIPPFQKETSEKESKVHYLYRLIMEQVGFKKREFSEFE